MVATRDTVEKATHNLYTETDLLKCSSEDRLFVFRHPLFPASPFPILNHAERSYHDKSTKNDIENWAGNALLAVT